MKKRNTALLMVCWIFLCFWGAASAAQRPQDQNPKGQPGEEAHAGPGDVGRGGENSPHGGLHGSEPPGGRVPAVFLPSSFRDEGDVSIIVEKSSQTLMLYEMFPRPRELFRVRCSTGKNFGPKTLSGDAKTPEGVYFFTQEHEEKYLSPIYGVKAFPTDYPNLVDRLARRTGSAIWLHGVDKPLAPYDSNGCVAVGNADLLALAPFIALNRTPIIIVETLQYHPLDAGKAAATAVEALVEAWHQAVQSAEHEDFMGCYDGAATSVPSWWDAWMQLREMMLLNDVPPMLAAKNIAVYRHRNAFVAVCDQYLQAGSAPLWVGTKKFFMEYQAGRLVILGDTYQAVSDIQQEDPLENPLIAVSRRLGASLDTALEDAGPSETPAGAGEAAIPIDAWLDDWMLAWSSNDFDAYGDFYADEFRSQGMDKRTWLKYKKKVNRKYRFIRLSKRDVVLAPLEDQLVVSFTQEYESNAFRSVGIKKLVLIRQDEGWKIYRETWERL